MRLTITIKRRSWRGIIFGVFFVFCFIPFLFPNPIVKTNIQPYASLIGIIVLLYFTNAWQYLYARNTFIVLSAVFSVAIVTMIFSGVSIASIRGVYNYFALFIIPCATIGALETSEEFPEKLCKTMILLWFAVSSVQFFLYRGFATSLIGGVRWSYHYRGVVGLASEPSFLGISCFYFLHIIRHFKSGKGVYSVLILIMGVLYAQSTTGIIFIAGYIAVYLLDIINSRRGIYIWGVSLVSLFVFIFYLETELADSRMTQMLNAFFNGGVDSVLEDGSAMIRFNAIGRALQLAISNRLIPSGFGARIGSAYGGLLVELGLFAIPAILLISKGMSLTFNKKRSQVAYFVVVTLLLLNNTQIGNPLLLMTIGMNLYARSDKKISC